MYQRNRPYRKQLHSAGHMAVPGQDWPNRSEVMGEVRANPTTELRMVRVGNTSTYQLVTVHKFSPVPLPHPSKRRGGGLRPKIYRTR